MNKDNDYWELLRSIDAYLESSTFSYYVRKLNHGISLRKSHIGMEETKGIIFLPFSIKPARYRYAWKANIFWETAHLPLP